MKQPRTVVLGIRLTPEEHATIQVRAWKNRGATVAAWARETLLEAARKAAKR